MASCIALYNRWKLRRTQVSEWTAEHRRPLRHYGLTFAGSQWEVWCTTPAAFDEWTGCCMRAVCRGDATVPADVVQLLQWINEIHFWGLTVHGKACKDDIYALAIRDDELDQADISLLHVDEP